MSKRNKRSDAGFALANGAESGYDRVDADGNKVVSSGAPSPTSPAWTGIFSTALVSNLTIKGSAGKLRSVAGRVDSSIANGTYYLQLWNLIVVPADATAVSSGNSLMAPFKIVAAGGDNLFTLDFDELGIPASVGISIGLSTTEFTKTAAGSFLSINLAEFA